MTTATRTRVDRLVRREADGSADPGFDRHLVLHGPLVLPSRQDRRWGDAVWREVDASGLTGRGGGGFPAAGKWEAVIRSDRPPLVIVNAMESEPASAKDRVLLAHAPHLVLDGALVVAALCGARHVVVCVADDRDHGARAVNRALVERGPTSCPVTVRRPPVRFVTGEESALVSWLEGGEARPVFRFDRSIPLTLGRRPAIIHNAETLAHVALIVRHGAAWFRQAGTTDAPGSTLVTVSGAVGAPGVQEVELGTPVAELVDRAGPTEAVGGLLLGGYGGTWLDPAMASTPYAPGPLRSAGAVLGAGVVVVLPASSCGIAETARIARYLAGESAGQCGPCVFGLPAIAGDLELLAAGRTDPEVLGRIAARGASVDGRGACRHPDGVARLVESALDVFATDARAHAEGRPCAGSALPTILQFPERRVSAGAVRTGAA